MHRLLFCLIAALGLWVAACSRLEPPEKSGELVVAIRADPVFFSAEGEDSSASGIEHDLIEAFAAELKLRVRYVVAQDAQELMDLVRGRKAHLAAAAPVGGNNGLRYTPPLREVGLVLVQPADSAGSADLEGIAGRTVEALPGAPALMALRPMQARATFTIAEVPETNELGLLSRINERRSDLAAVDRIHFDIGLTYYPELAVAADLPGKVAYAWAFHSEDGALYEQAQAFIARIANDGTLTRLNDRYFGHIRRLNPNDIAQFMERVQTRLPHFRATFHEAELLTGIDWRLLAALAYQESAWDPLATSPTGVRGMMMLTEETADRLRVSNRLDPRQSIRAGARYLEDLIDAMPDTAEEPDRTWLALAAYNIGPGHFNGALAIARGLNRDIASWYEMKRVLPLLAQPRYYNRLKSGRARGGEAVIMVENIRNYHDILTRLERPYVPVVTPPQ